MTLQQAHEIQRKELISLRAENARLKKHISISDSERPEIKELAALRAENARLKQYNFLQHQNVFITVYKAFSKTPPILSNNLC